MSSSSDIYKTNRVPTDRITVLKVKEPPSVAQFIDGETLHAILRAAEGGHVEPLFTLYRDIVVGDPHIQGELSKRKLAVLGDPLSVQPWDKKSEDDKAAAVAVESLLYNSKPFFHAISHLLDGTLWPVSLIEKVFKPGAGLYRYDLDQLVPVPHRLLDYRTDELRIRDTDDSGRLLTTTHEADPARYMIHRGHLLSIPDQFGGPMRSLVFWWLLTNMNRTWWARFLERFGSGFIVAKYPAGDDDTREVLESAISYSVKIGGLVISENASVEIKEALRSDGSAYEKFIDAGRREISRLILGQTMSATAEPTGMGSGVADQHETVRRDIRRLDALLMGWTVRLDLIRQWMSINGIRGNPPIILWSEDTSKEAAALGELLSKFALAGLEVEDDALYSIGDRIGFGVRRKAASASAFPFNVYAAGGKTGAAPGVTSADASARGASAPVAQAIRDRFAGYRKIIIESRSPDECLRRMEAYFSDLDTGDLVDLIDHSLTTYAANALVAMPASEES